MNKWQKNTGVVPKGLTPNSILKLEYEDGYTTTVFSYLSPSGDFIDDVLDYMKKDAWKLGTEFSIRRYMIVGEKLL